MKIIFQLICFFISSVFFAQNLDSLKIFNVSKFKPDSSIVNIKFINNKFYGIKNDSLVCFDLNGNFIWVFKLSGSLTSNLIFVNNNLLFIDSNFELTFLDVERGTKIQELGLNIFSNSKIYPIQLKKINNDFLWDEDKINALIVVFDNGVISCLDLYSLNEIWNRNFDEQFDSLPQFTKNKFLITTKSGFIYNIDLTNGLLLWKWKEKEDFSINHNYLFTDDKSILFLNDQGVLYSVNLLLGKLNWKHDNVNAKSILFLSDDNKSVFIQIENNYIQQINTKDGNILKEIKDKLITNIISSFLIKSKIFLLTENNILYFDKNKLKTFYEFENNIVELIYFDEQKIILKDFENNIHLLNIGL